MTAYKNPDGTLIVVMLNRGDEVIPVTLRLDGKIVAFGAEPGEILTGEIRS